MSIIRQLPPHVVNKIAAGEVVERPASVVKELLENALDAGATRIDVAVEQGGIDLVRVVDNGRGMTADDLPLAVASHATSKLIDDADLFRVRTLGFRGEALASIASISRLTLRSRQADATAGVQLEVHGGQPGEVAPCAASVGTTIEVRDLFFNTPVRRKFLRATQTELGHIGEAFSRMALAYPQIHFTLSHQGRSIHDLPAADTWRQRIAALLGEDLARDMIEVASEDNNVRLHGYVGSPAHSRTNARLQYLFLNGRTIRDRSLQHALGEAYRGLLLTGRYPVCCLRIDMPADMVDVNVHPTKLEVRFQDSGRIYSQLLSTLRTKFLTSDLTHRLEPVRQDEAVSLPAAHGLQPVSTENFWQGSQPQLPGTFALDPPRHPGPLQLNRLDRPWPQAPVAFEEVAPPQNGSHTAEFQAAATARPHGRTSALQIHNRYLVAESDEGVLVIDQHALHERILYEHLRERAAQGNIESQNLLVPEPVDLSPAEAAAVLEARDTLAKLGLIVEPFGGSTVLVSSYPAMLANLGPAQLLRDLLELLQTGGKQLEPRDLLDDVLHMIACKAAIKAGDRLTPEEITALLDQRHLAQDQHHCPHGRPTALLFTREELDRQFMRI